MKTRFRNGYSAERAKIVSSWPNTKVPNSMHPLRWRPFFPSGIFAASDA